jgi:predicted mannosyl-3-phosphoglycerate phosphatase (HAD superfamily)
LWPHQLRIQFTFRSVAAGGFLRSSNTVVFCAIDDLIPIAGKPLTGFSDFLTSLSESAIPCVWITARNRHQLDSALRKLGHGEPFIGEGGSSVYVAEDYFHLRPAHTVRLGRFIAIPVAQPQPAAADALESLSEETGITVVPLRSLSPRELIQNTGLGKGEAEAIRQRDFDELFFFAGATDKDIHRFQLQAAHRKALVRPHGAFWSLAVHPSVSTCIRELRKLYDRAFHKPAFSVGVATAADAEGLFSACDRAILLTARGEKGDAGRPKTGPPPKALPLFGPETWSDAVEAIQNRQFL